MSYVEQALYNWIKSLLSGGLKVLKRKRFATYTYLVLSLTIGVTIASFLKGYTPLAYTIVFDLEIAVCASLVITGVISIKVWDVYKEFAVFIGLTIMFFVVSAFLPEAYILAVENAIVMSSFYVWVITVNLVTLITVRSVIVSWPGWVMKLGDPEDRVVFSPIIKLIVAASLGWFIYLLLTGKIFFLGLLAILTAWAVLYGILVFSKVHKESNLASILSIFFIYSLYHLLVTTARLTGFIFVDAALVLFTTIITAQGISNLIAGKKHLVPYHWDSLIILVLGFALGYHILAVKIGFAGLGFLLSVYHDLSFGFCSLIIFGALLLYWFYKPFRQFSKTEITPRNVVESAVDLGSTAVKQGVKNIKKKLKKGWKFEVKKPED